MSTGSIKLYIGRKPRKVVLSIGGYNLLFQKHNNPNNGGLIEKELQQLQSSQHKILQEEEQQEVKKQQQVQAQQNKTPTVKLRQITDQELNDQNQYVPIPNYTIDGFVGLIVLNNMIYIGLVTGSQKVGFPRWKLDKNKNRIIPSENISKVIDVDFLSLETSIYDPLHFDRNDQNYEKLMHEHPCGSFKKMFSDGTFYFSKDFDISTTVKNHGLTHNMDYIIDNQDSNFLWNFALVNEIISWRSRLPSKEKTSFDDSKILTFLIRGFCKTSVIRDNPGPSSVDSSASITILSRISTETREKSLSNECITEDGRISNFIETEIVVATTKFIFSYTQIGANIPLFWDVVDNQLIYNKKKVKLMKDAVNTQAAFDKHFDALESKYGVVSILNIVKPKSDSQDVLAQVYKSCATEKGLKITNIEDHISTLIKTPHKILYLLKEDLYELGAFTYDITKGIYFGKQTGVIRLSAFDSLEKQIKIESIISREIIELTAREIDDFELTTPLIESHDQLWFQNGYVLSKLSHKNTRNPAKYKKLYSKLFESRIRLYDPLHYYISHHLRKLRSNFTYSRDITLFCATFNVSGKLPEVDLGEWIMPENSGLDEMAQAYIIGLEEVIELTPGHMLSADPFVKSYWEKKILTHLNNRGGRQYTRRWSNQLGGVLLMFFVEESEYSKIKNIEGDVKKTGFGGMTSNKGAVAMSFKYSNTSFCIVASHLAAGLDNVEQRHNDYKTIFRNIRFAKGAKIKDHDAIIWMGDFNYRILMSNEDVRRLINEGDFATLFQKDQLNQQMISGESFPYFHEMPINFPPTYKFDPGTKIYDTSEKMRIPAWTDRILSKGELLKQLSYGYAEDIIFSDHRPVFATFQAKIAVVDEKERTALFNKIYEALKNKLATLSDSDKILFLNNKALLSEHGLDPESASVNNMTTQLQGWENRSSRLPPPSSDLKKWWIGSGKQVKVVLNIDSENLMLNPERDCNPFIQDSNEPVFVER